MKSSERVFLLVAVVGLGIHGLALGLGSYQKTYDAYTHLFFASHWLNSWWEAFEPRWYTGFSVFTYPPFAHQLVALPAKWLGLEPAYLGVQMLCLGALVTGMYRYTRIWFEPAVARLSALLLLFSPALTMTLHLFGQYPNLVSLALTLHLLAFVDIFLQSEPAAHKRWQALLLAECLLMATAFTSLFANFMGVFFFALPLLIKHWRREVWHRLLFLVTLGAGTLLACLSPFFAYMREHPLSQVQIPHGSRDNVLAWVPLNYFTFYGLYGVMLPVLGLWLFYAFKTRQHRAFVFPVLFLLLLSTGGATPINAWLLGPLFDVLTFDRFAFWNSLLALPVVADLLWRTYHTLSQQRGRRLLAGAGATLLLGLYLTGFVVNLTAFRWHALPPVLDLAPVQAVLQRPDYAQRRYLTLGLGGHNVSALSMKHPAETLDGNYNFGRRIPELNQAPIALLDDAKYYGEPGIDALAKVLLDPRKYGLKVVFLRDQYYTPLLEASGWHLVEHLSQGVDVWEAGLDIAPRSPYAVSPWHRPWAQWIWSVMPLSSFAAFGVLWFWWRYQHKRGVLS